MGLSPAAAPKITARPTPNLAKFLMEQSKIPTSYEIWDSHCPLPGVRVGVTAHKAALTELRTPLGQQLP